MKKANIEKEPKIQFNRGNPDSPVPPGTSVHDQNNEDTSKAGKKRKKAREKRIVR